MNTLSSTRETITAPAVRCAGLVKEFGTGETRTRVLRGIDLEIPMGRITMLVGPSGCGKTTLISVLAGLLRRTAGTMEVLGCDPDHLPPSAQAEFRRRNLGFIFQQYNLLPSLTAAENAAAPLLAAGEPLPRATARAGEFLASLQMGERVAARPSELSGGQQQRVAIARALVHAPRLVLCDEPTAALDAASGHLVIELLARTAVAPDRAVVIVTHDNRIFGFADRIVHMEDGQIREIEES